MFRLQQVCYYVPHRHIQAGGVRERERESVFIVFLVYKLF